MSARNLLKVKPTSKDVVWSAINMLSVLQCRICGQQFDTVAKKGDPIPKKPITFNTIIGTELMAEKLYKHQREFHPNTFIGDMWVKVGELVDV